MIAASLALLALVSADVAAPAAEARAPVIDVSALLPAADGTVPLNGRLVFLGATGVSFVRVQVDEAGAPIEDELVVDEVVPVDQFFVAHIVALPAGLAAGDQLVVQSRCPEGCSFQGTWTVVDEDTTAPTFLDGPARATGEHIDPAFGGTSGGYFITVELPGATDASGATIIELRGDINQLAQQSFAQGAPMDVFITDLDDSERTTCFDAFAIDAAGNETAFRDELCVQLTHPFLGGCSSTPVSSTGLSALLLLALTLVRRRR